MRSWIESASVLAIPNRETRERQGQQRVDQVDEVVDLPLLLFLQLLLI